MSSNRQSPDETRENLRIALFGHAMAKKWFYISANKMHLGCPNYNEPIGSLSLM